MNILAIETSCDETAAAIVSDGRRVLAETIASQMEIHARFGGVVPEVAARQHVVSVTAVVAQTFADAHMSFADIDAIAVTHGPGLLGALLVGLSAAKGYALATGLPLVGVHHIAGHVAAAFLDTNLAPPLLALVVSGGHTELLVVEPGFRFRKLGGTKDDAAGEAYDKVARMLGLPYPGGPQVDKLAQTGDPAAYSFPRSLSGDGSFDFSYSGLKSAVHNELAKRRARSEAVVAADVCASFQQAVVDVLVEKTAAAVAATGMRTVVLAGGVAANSGLRSAIEARAAADGFSVHLPPLSLCTDNAAMIGAAAYFATAQGRHLGGARRGLIVPISPGSSQEARLPRLEPGFAGLHRDPARPDPERLDPERLESERLESGPGSAGLHRAGPGRGLELNADATLSLRAWQDSLRDDSAGS